LGSVRNLDTRAAFHDRVLLPGRPGSGAKFDAARCAGEQVALERVLRNESAGTVRPVGTMGQFRLGKNSERALAARLFCSPAFFNLHTSGLKSSYLTLWLLRAALGVTWKFERVAACLFLPYFFVGELCGGAELHVLKMNPPVSRSMSELPTALPSRFASQPDCRRISGSNAW